ncbi:hypothetical protein NKJ81_31470, partial [Mesorhizobium sp. M0018]
SSFASTLYPDASVEIDPATPGAEIYTRYPHPDIKMTGTTKAFLHRDHLASVRMVTLQNRTRSPPDASLLPSSIHLWTDAK